MNLRAHVAKLLKAIIIDGKSSSECTAGLNELPESERALARNLLSGTLRYYFSLDALSKKLISKPLKQKDYDVHCLVLLGFYQLIHMRVPNHAALSETVAASKALKKIWAKGLINAVLRNFLRNKENLLAEINKRESARYELPEWLLSSIKSDYPDNAVLIFEGLKQRAPLTLRVNRRVNCREDFLNQLIDAGIDAEVDNAAPDALRLTESTDVTRLPGFSDGAFSVQDAAAQLAAHILAPEPGERILDACAAPGGKTCHLLEFTDNKLDLLAIDNDEARLSRVQENLTRLKLDANLKCADLTERSAWFDDKPFDRILLDAPCSATGVMRRHPDIKLHRRASDIDELSHLQARLLDELWQTLKTGGVMVYATCSIFKQENEEQIAAFLSRHINAQLLELPGQDKRSYQASFGMQFLPNEAGRDGFFYAKLQKTE